MHGSEESALRAVADGKMSRKRNKYLAAGLGSIQFARELEAAPIGSFRSIRGLDRADSGEYGVDSPIG
jgi:hypothetical protein